MIVDKTGRKLKIGQVLDMIMIGSYQGKLIGIKEQPIIMSATQQIPAHIVIACSITPHINRGGMVPDVYILADADPNDPIVKAAEEEEKRNSKRIIM